MTRPRTSQFLKKFIAIGLFFGISILNVSLRAQDVASTVKKEVAPPKPITMTADGELKPDPKTGEMTMNKNVVISYGGAVLLADKATLNQETKQAHAEGNVRLRHGEKEWLSETLDYNFATGVMKAGKARGQLEDGIYFEAPSLETSNPNEYILKDAWFTTSDYDKPGYRLKASSIIVYPKNRIAFHNVVLYTGPVPIFYWPYFVYPLDDEKDPGFNTGTNVQFGSKGNWGFFVLNSYTTRISEDLRPTFRFDWRESRGFAGGVDLRYKAGDKYDPEKEGEFQPRVSGKIKTYFADDDKIRNNRTQQVVTSTSTGTQTFVPERYRVSVAQHATLREDIYSKLKVDKLSDINLLEDFYEKEFQINPQPDNFLEITKWSPNATLSILSRPQINDFFTTTERLPEIRYDLKRQKIPELPFFYEGENSIAYLSKEFAKGSAASDYGTARVDTFHQFLYPKQYLGWLNLTPKVGGRATFYDQSNLSRNQPSVVRAVANAGFEASFKATRTWKDVQDKQWDIDGLRHIVEPGLNYAFVTSPTHRPSQLYQFDVDRSSFGINKDLVPIDFPQYTGIDSIDKRNVFRPLVRQRLQTKRDKANWDLAELLIYQDILVEKHHDEKSFSDLFTEFTARPTRWLSLDWRGRFDYDQTQFRESRTTASILKDKLWRVGLSHNYFRGVGDQIGADFAWSINEDWALRTSHRFDPSDGSLFEQSYSLDRDLHSWLVSFTFSQLRPLNRDDDIRFWLTFTLKAFPDISFDSKTVGGGDSE